MAQLNGDEGALLLKHFDSITPENIMKPESIAPGKGKIYVWDVVNEPVNVSSLRESEWLKIIGEDYIEKAFYRAHEADQEAKLFLNEIDTIEKIKREYICNLVQGLIDKGVPIHGIGLQLHISLDYPSLEALDAALEQYSKLGLEIHIT